MGRPRKPTNLKILHGDFDKNPQRRNHAEPMPEQKTPPKPKHLHGESLSEWKRVTKELSSIKVLTEVDRAAVEQYAEVWGRWREAMEDCKRNGSVLHSESGAYENPASKIASRCADQIHKYLCQFGLTPASRSRVNVTQQTAPVRMRRQRG